MQVADYTLVETPRIEKMWRKQGTDYRDKAATPEERKARERRAWLGTLLPRFKSPLALCYWRQIEVALEEAQDTRYNKPTDEALLARDWIVRPSPARTDRLAFITSFQFACELLELPVDEMRARMLRVIDAKANFLTRDAIDRLERLKAEPLPGDEVERFAAPRVVPSRDQQRLF